MGMTREGRASSSRSKKNTSMPSALREKIEKLAPPCPSVAPMGELRPVVGAASEGCTTVCCRYRMLKLTVPHVHSARHDALTSESGTYENPSRICFGTLGTCRHACRCRRLSRVD